VWLQKAEKIAVSEVAQRLGLKSFRGNSWGPCPNCHAVERGSNDKRGTIGLNSENIGWMCHRCKAKGSGIDLVSFQIGGSKFSQLDQMNKKKVQVWFDGEINDGAKIFDKPQKLRGARPPLNEVQQLWGSSLKLHQLSKDDKAISFLKSRNLNLEALARSGVARVTPEYKAYEWPTWWPGGRSNLWRIIVPAFNDKGQLTSLHARAIDVPEVGPKTLWPKGYEAKGLFMPNRFAVKMMRGLPVDLDGLLFVEGITDFMKCSAEVEDQGLNIAVLGGTSGSFGIVSKLKIPKKTKIYIGTDPDDQGREYASTIQLQLGDRISYRIPLEDLMGEANA
tara:strand:+ start:1339 stop:2343 length:1005 start_codon:yes stop_codon:yes gene_type:complete